ncbi:SmdB family multidrug efflux ABC transporter permease/ATP-binding protein [Proteus alimentorum]|uniref:SmdB family multidrug efflux ABC transporter permease/ATP-binding protein n=2 Tax=Proteus alimentorum TaxID=1973495 RepID=A0ABS0ISY5_9GAMM|nr:SmdB family multidrug efflux ABC transporter permease/ATP-binding protein [Proteus alimentorum]MBG2876292.1 SmdB family multidrug efflux ABC transporter permease/ATP-binding protein [Proteus alimentorum]MBG2878949.1 SmdB family multidrug efflux ABC transporter permease/ATP-binding protein [Proteus alimentorum]
MNKNKSVKALLPALKRLLTYGKAYRKPMTWGVIMLWVAAVAEVGGPLIVGYFIDAKVATNNVELMSSLGLALAFILLQVIAATLHYYQAIVFNHAAVGVVQQLRTDVMSAALKQPLSAFDNQPVGQLISRVTNDTETIKDLFVNVLPTLFRAIALVVVMLIAMFLLEWQMALVAMMIFPAVIGVMMLYQRLSTPIVRNVRHFLANINDGFHEVINGMSVIQQFRQQARFGERMSDDSWQHYQARMKALKLDGLLLRPLLSMLSALVLCGLLMLFGYQGSAVIGVGVIYAFISYLGRLNEPLITLTSQQSILQQAVVSGERVFELMDAPLQHYGSSSHSITQGNIDVNSLWFAYRDEQWVLKDINLTIPARHFVAFVGHTGSGKSTLASLLMGNYPWQKGSISLDKQPLEMYSHAALRSGIAMVQQDPVLLSGSLHDNITLGRECDESHLWQVLEAVQLDQWAKALPEGLQTELGEQGSRLSAGQKQLLALARVLLIPPRILILDEATANIDSGTEQAIQKALKVVREKTTLIVIAHRLSTIIEANEIVVLHRGAIVEQGDHAKLLSQKGRYYNMYQLQQVRESLQEQDPINVE